MVTGKLTLPSNMCLDLLTFKDYFQCYQQVPETEKYYTKENSSIWQMFDEDSPDWLTAVDADSGVVGFPERICMFRRDVFIKQVKQSV